MIFSFFLARASSFYIDKDLLLFNSVGYLSVFGFGAGSTFNITISKLKSRTVSISLMTKSNYEILQLDTIDQDTILCTENNTLSHYSYYADAINGTANFYGEVATRSNFMTVVKLCGFSQHRVHIIADFKNRKTLLDLNARPCLYTKPMVCAIAIGGFAVWLISWIVQIKYSNALTTFISINFILTCLYFVLECQFFYKRNITDKTSSYEIAVTVVECVECVSMLTMIMMVSQGWCVVRETLKFKEILKAIFCSFLVSLAILLTNIIQTGRYEFIMLFAIMFTLLIYMYVMYVSIRECLLLVHAHLYAISLQNIDPYTTPIYNKLSMFRIISYSVLVYFFINWSSELTLELLDIMFWPIDFLRDLANVGLLLSVSFVFRFKRVTRKGYMLIDENENQEIMHFKKNEILSIIAEKNFFFSGNKVWKDGMDLPMQPIISEEIVSNVEEESGSDSINVTELTSLNIPN